ncbi:MAG: hypothetical protein GY722_14880 [bacterium]|nr:hypothetical protein [bacterium]
MDKNNEDQPLSSEELLRRAREGLGESGEDAAAPPADFNIESSPPSAADPEMSPEYSDSSPTVSGISYEPSDQPSPPDPEPYEPPSYDSPAFETPAAPPRSDPSSWAPPPVDSDTDWAAASAPAERSGGGKVWIFLAIAVVLGFGAFSLFDSSTTVDDIAVGDCLDTPSEDVFSTIETIDCSEPHDLEVFALVDLADFGPEFSSVASYPGDDPVYEAAQALCWDAFEPYVGVPYEESVLYLDAFTPTLEGWDERGDRIANCVLFEVNAANDGLVQSQHSLQGANR